MPKLIERHDVEFAHHLDKTLAADIVAARQRIGVAFGVDRQPRVAADHRHQRFVDDALIDQLQHGDVEPLHEDVGGIRPEADAADIHQMAGAGKQRDQPAVLEARRGDDEIVEMAGPHPGIVGDVGVALLHRQNRETGDEMLDRLGHGIDMPWRAGHGLRQHPPLRIEHAGREVAALAHDRTEGRSQQNLRLFLDHGDQPVPHDLQIDQARAAFLAHGYAAFRSITMLPAPSIWALKLVETNVEVSSSAITAGPAMVAPGAIWSRRYRGISTTCPARPSKKVRLPDAWPAGMRVTSATRGGFRGSVVASTDQLSTSIAAPGIGRSNKAV